MKKIGVLLTVLIISVLSVKGQSLKTVADWEGKFIKNESEQHDLDNTLSLSKDSWSYYKLAYSLDAYNQMFQATGKVSYLNRSLELINNIINGAVASSQLPKSQFKDNFLSWANHSHEQIGNDGKEYPLFESFCWRYVTSLLVILKNSPDILSNKSYAGQYANILKFTETNIFDKWLSRGKQNIFRSNVHMSSHWARISLDLWLVTGKSKYQSVFNTFDANFKKQLNLEDDTVKAYIWSAPWKTKLDQGRNFKKETLTDPQDVSHGNAVIGYIIESYEANVGVYNKEDIDDMLATFSRIIWMGKNKFAMNVNGQGVGTGRAAVDGFMKLGRYSSALQERIEQFEFGRSTVYDRSDQFYATGCLNAKILSDKKPVYPSK